MKLLSKKSSSNDHSFSQSICQQCKRTTEELFWELIDMDNDDALKFIYSVQALGHAYSEYERDRIVKDNHKECLTKDEVMIRDIIE